MQLLIFKTPPYNLIFFYINLLQDLEKRSDGGIPTEEAIESLKKSYKSSKTYQQVQRQVAEICKQVIN